MMGKNSSKSKSRKRRKNQTMSMQVLKRLSKNKMAMFGIIVLILIFILSFIGPLFCKYSYNEMILAERYQAPSLNHLFGTDSYGRDVFTRIIYGGRYSLTLGLCGALAGMIVGCALGLIDGYIGGNFDTFFMRLIDIWSAIPGTLLAMTISTVLGPGFFNTIIALSIGSVPFCVRLLRGNILSERSAEYLEAAVSINCSPVKIMFRHIFPNVVSPVIVNTTMNVGGVISSAAALSYLGLGIQPPMPEWGAMLSESKGVMSTYPWLVLFPGLAIAIVIFCVNMFGDGLRDALDPKLKQ